jgi:hypothetical protein
MVLVGERSAEQRHDSVAHDLIHGTFVIVHCLHHAVENGIEQLTGLFGIAIGEELGGTLEIGEQDRYLFALAFERRLGCQDPLGEMSWNLGAGSSRG